MHASLRSGLLCCRNFAVHPRISASSLAPVVRADVCQQSQRQNQGSQTSVSKAASLHMRAVQPFWRNILDNHSSPSGSSSSSNGSRSRSRNSGSSCHSLGVVPSSSCSSGPWQPCKGSPSDLITNGSLAMAASPAWFVALMPAVLTPGSFSDWGWRWTMESLIGYNGATMGLPGMAANIIFWTPMMETMPQIRREKSVGLMPLLPYTAMVSQSFIFIFYGLLKENPAIWTTNMCGGLLGLYYCYVFYRHCPVDADWLPYTTKHHATVVLATITVSGGAALFLPHAMSTTLLGMMGNVMTISMFGGPLAATYTVLKEKSTRSMNFGFTCAINLNCNLWFFYAYFVIDDPFIYIQDGVGLVLTAVQLSLFWRFGIHRGTWRKR